MANSKLGELSVWLTARDEASGKLMNVRRAVTALAGSFAVLKAIQLTKEAVNLAEEVGKLADAFNLTVGEIQQLQFAAKIMDTDFTAVAKAVAKFQVQAVKVTEGSEGATDAFNALRIKVTDVNGKVKTGMEIFLEVADAMHNGTLTAEEFAAATELLGMRFALNVIPMLTEGREAIEKLMNEEKRMGELSLAQVNNLRALGDAVDRVQVSFQKFWAGLASSLIPALEALANNILPFLITSWNRWVIAIATATKWYYELTKAMNSALGYSAGVEYSAKQIAIIEGNIVALKREIGLTGQAFAMEIPKGIKKASDEMDNLNAKVNVFNKSAFGTQEWLPALMKIGGDVAGVMKVGEEPKWVGEWLKQMEGKEIEPPGEKIIMPVQETKPLALPEMPTMALPEMPTISIARNAMAGLQLPQLKMPQLELPKLSFQEGITRQGMNILNFTIYASDDKVGQAVQAALNKSIH